MSDFARAGRIKPACWLVEQQQAWRPQQRRGDSEPLTHPGRVAADPVTRTVEQIDALQSGIDALPRAGAVQLGEQLEVRSP